MIYRKRGVTIRWENGTRVVVTESGVAVEKDELFTCYPDDRKAKGEGRKAKDEERKAKGEGRKAKDEERESRPLSSIEWFESSLGSVASSFDSFLSALPFPPLAPSFTSSSSPPSSFTFRPSPFTFPYERVVVTRGYAEHEYGEKQWSEHTRRFHASLVHGRLRAIVDHVEDLEPIAEALSRTEANEREAPKHLRLAPNVAAALIPALPGIVQTEGGLDGYGDPIVESRGEPWPNFYRPSYRVRPVRMPLNVRLEHERTAIDGDLPVAVALLAFPAGNTARVLIVDGPRVYPSFVVVTRVEAVADTRTWYPYGGGSFGAEMML